MEPFLKNHVAFNCKKRCLLALALLILQRGCNLFVSGPDTLSVGSSLRGNQTIILTMVPLNWGFSIRMEQTTGMLESGMLRSLTTPLFGWLTEKLPSKTCLAFSLCLHLVTSLSLICKETPFGRVMILSKHRHP